MTAVVETFKTNVKILCKNNNPGNEWLGGARYFCKNYFTVKIISVYTK